MPCIKKAALPRYNSRRGWTGGNSRVLYLFRDKLTGKKIVRPGGGPRKKLLGAPGSNATVRVATRGEAEQYWQKPLHAGWNYACPR